LALRKPLGTQEASDRVASDPERPRNLVDTDALPVQRMHRLESLVALGAALLLVTLDPAGAVRGGRHEQRRTVDRRRSR
jgi:hypothetical protein